LIFSSDWLLIPTTRFELSFLTLVAIQAAHLIEEYVDRLYDVSPPARFLSGLICHDLKRGFVIFNLGLLLFGLSHRFVYSVGVTEFPPCDASGLCNMKQST
jgi:hypothetical protein